MVSKNNLKWKQQRDAQRVPHYGLRKLSVGVASVLLSTTLYMGATASADTVSEPSGEPAVTQPTSTATGSSAGDATANAQPKSTADQPASAVTGASTDNTTADTKPVQTANAVTTQPTADQPASSVTSGAQSSDNSAAPKNNVSAQSAPTALPKQPSNVASDNNDLTPKKETVDSTWTLHYVKQADHKQELKDPTVINKQYMRTNTPQSDGTIQHGDWSYVPGSFKQTGTPITVYGSDDPAKRDNVDENGENFDVFTITAKYPTIEGYEFHDGAGGGRLSDDLRNDDRQAATMSEDAYVEYDVAKSVVDESLIDESLIDKSLIDKNDLTRTVTRTIKIVQPDGTIINKVQTVHLTRTATVDKANKANVTYGEWSTSQWDAYEVPTVDGYTPSHETVEAATVDGIPTTRM